MNMNLISEKTRLKNEGKMFLGYSDVTLSSTTKYNGKLVDWVMLHIHTMIDPYVGANNIRKHIES